MTVANFIIAGTEKAGTTSVFSWLAQHPEVVASRRKETNFFRSAGGTLDDYAAHFPTARGARVVVEASPAYLGEAAEVVPRMRALVPEVKLLFILRDPVERFLSSFHFHHKKLNLPEELGFSEYLDACLSYAEGRSAAVDIGDWYLKVLEFGCYARYLQQYYDAFPREQIRVAFYNDLRGDPRGFMEDLGDFLGLEPSHWASADFQPVNVTFSGRSRVLHRLAIMVNDRLEPLLRPRPGLKTAVVNVYKRLNAAKEGYDGMPASDRARLEAFYAPHNRELTKLLRTPLPESWVTAVSTRDSTWRPEKGRVATS